MPKIKYDMYQDRDQSVHFPREVKYLMKKYGCKRSDIEIDTRHPCGEDTIFIKGVWCGYIDEVFYEEMNND